MTLDIKLPEGFELIGNYNNQYVIAKNEHPGAPEPYVVWAVDYDKRGVHSAHISILANGTAKLL